MMCAFERGGAAGVRPWQVPQAPVAGVFQVGDQLTHLVAGRGDVTLLNLM